MPIRSKTIQTKKKRSLNARKYWQRQVVRLLKLPTSARRKKEIAKERCIGSEVD